AFHSNPFGGNCFHSANRLHLKRQYDQYHLLTRLYSNFLAHPSLKILLNFHFLWVYLTCAFVATDHSYTAYLLATLRSSVDLLQSQQHCMIRKGVHITLLYGTITSMYAISFERRSASAHFQTYESTSRSYGYKLTIVHLIIVAALSVGFFRTYGYDEEIVALCTITTPHGELYQRTVGAVAICMEVWTIYTFVKLLNANKIRKEKSYSLSEKYQITENIRMLGIMLPIDTINNGFLIGYTMPFFFLRQFMQDADHKRGVIATNCTTGDVLSLAHCAAIQARWSPSDLLQTEKLCMMRKGIHVAVMYATVTSMLAISFERKRASAQVGTYERTSRAYGYKLVAWHLIAVGVYSVGYAASYGYREPIVALCTVTTPRGESYHQAAGASTIAIEIWTITSFVKLLKANMMKRDESKLCSLTERSHVATTCICLSVFLIGLAYGFTRRSFPLFEDSINNAFLQGFFMPYFFFRQFRHDTRYKRKLITVNTGEGLSTAHYAAIQRGW
uniref:G protein-coupled receptor n=1 Tax=Pristionchus pacificus TaxID=54126 RepID=A0A8R1V182_PRIPA